MISLDLSALDGLAIAGYPLATILICMTVAGIVCIVAGVFVRWLLDTWMLSFLGVCLILSAGGTYLVNVF